MSFDDSRLEDSASPCLALVYLRTLLRLLYTWMGCFLSVSTVNFCGSVIIIS